MTWTPVVKQDETWTGPPVLVRVFDPAVFDHRPIFDTGPASGLWADKTEQSEVWTTL